MWEYTIVNKNFFKKFKTALAPINLARNTWKNEQVQSYIYKVDWQDKKIENVPWQFKIKNVTENKILDNIYYDYSMCVEDICYLEQNTHDTYEVVNEFGERW